MNEFLVIPAASWLEHPFQKTAKPSALGGKPHLSAPEGPGTGKSGVQCPHGAAEDVCSGASVPETRAFVLLIVSRVLKAVIFLDLSQSWWENCLILLLAPGRGITGQWKDTVSQFYPYGTLGLSFPVSNLGVRVPTTWHCREAQGEMRSLGT